MEDNTRLKNAIDFLMWSYFNLTLDDGDNVDRILNTCIRKAYLDATQQGAYNTLIPKEKKALRDCSSQVEIAAGRSLRRKIDSLRECKDKFNQWHGETCKEIKEQYTEINSTERGELFSYGNAQKWVNMALKYVYTLYWLYKAFSSECEFCRKYGQMVSQYTKEFHVPIDSFMIEAYGKEDIPAWSKWTDGDYASLRKEHSETLDWEGPEWIKIAKGRKEKDFKGLEKRYGEK